MRCHVHKGELRHAGLALAEKLTRAAQFQITFGDNKAVIAVAHHGKP